MDRGTEGHGGTERERERAPKYTSICTQVKCTREGVPASPRHASSGARAGEQGAQPQSCRGCSQGCSSCLWCDWRRSLCGSRSCYVALHVHDPKRIRMDMCLDKRRHTRKYTHTDSNMRCIFLVKKGGHVLVGTAQGTNDSRDRETGRDTRPEQGAQQPPT